MNIKYMGDSFEYKRGIGDWLELGFGIIGSLVMSSAVAWVLAEFFFGRG